MRALPNTLTLAMSCEFSSTFSIKGWMNSKCPLSCTPTRAKETQTKGRQVSLGSSCNRYGNRHPKGQRELLHKVWLPPCVVQQACRRTVPNLIKYSCSEPSWPPPGQWARLIQVKEEIHMVQKGPQWRVKVFLLLFLQPHSARVTTGHGFQLQVL